MKIAGRWVVKECCPKILLLLDHQKHALGKQIQSTGQRKCTKHSKKLGMMLAGGSLGRDVAFHSVRKRIREKPGCAERSITETECAKD